MKCPICDAIIDDSIMAARVHKAWHEWKEPESKSDGREYEDHNWLK